MANDLTGNPWKVDTAAVLTTSNIYVERMVWAPNAAGDDISVTTNDGSELFVYKAIAGDTDGKITEPREFGYHVSGITVGTIDAGTLWIHTR